MSGDDEAVLLDAGDSCEFFNGGRGEAVAEEGGDEGGVFEPPAEAVREDFDYGKGVEGFVLLREGGLRRAVGLVEVLWLWGGGGGSVFGDDDVRD